MEYIPQYQGTSKYRYDQNVYYFPEHFDCVIVDRLDNSESYEFDYFVVWKASDGTLFYGEDSGCSCPTPFEDIKSFRILTDDNWAEFHDEVIKWSTPYSDWSRSVVTEADISEFFAKVSKAMR